MTTLTGLVLLLAAMADWSVAGEAVREDAVVVLLADETCGPAADLVDRIEARAGAGSVVDDGPRVVGVAFAGRAPAVEVTLTLEEAGVPAGARRLGPFADCGTAIDAAALAIALVIEPFAAPPPPPSPPPPPPPAPPRALFAPRRALEAPQRPWKVPPLSVGLGAAGGVGIGFGVAPGPMGLVRAHLQAGDLPVAVGVGGRVDLPGPLVIEGPRRLESVGGAFFIEGCGRLDRVDDVGALILDLCAFGEAGGLRAVAIGFDDPVEGNASLITAGAAMTARVPLWSALGLFVRVGASLPLLPGRLVSSGTTLWQSPVVAGQLTVGLDGLSGPR
jgi:hypothetical protein